MAPKTGKTNINMNTNYQSPITELDQNQSPSNTIDKSQDESFEIVVRRNSLNNRTTQNLNESIKKSDDKMVSNDKQSIDIEKILFNLTNRFSNSHSNLKDKLLEQTQQLENLKKNLNYYLNDQTNSDGKLINETQLHDLITPNQPFKERTQNKVNLNDKFKQSTNQIENQILIKNPISNLNDQTNSDGKLINKTQLPNFLLNPKLPFENIQRKTQSKVNSNDKFKQSTTQIEDQNLISNLNNQINLDDQLRFKVSLELRNDLNYLLNDFTSLLYEDKKLYIEKEVNDLIYRFADLPLKIDESLKIDNSQSTTTYSMKRKNQMKPALVLDSKFRSEILDLLIKNKNYTIFHFQYLINRNALINENNQMILKLLNHPVQMLKVDDNYFNLQKELSYPIGYYNYGSNYNKNLIPKNSKAMPILSSNLETGIGQFKSNPNPIEKKKSEEFNFLFKINTINFDNNTNYVHRTEKFSCLGLDWYLKIEYAEGTFNFCLVLMNESDFDNKKINIDCILDILNLNSRKINEELFLNYDYVPDRVATFDRTFTKKYLKNNEFIKDDQLDLKLNIIAEWIDEENAIGIDSSF